MMLNKTWLIGGVAAAALTLALYPAGPVLGGEGSTPTFSIGDGEGPAGGSAGVALSLDNDDGSAVSAGVDIEFNADDLTFTTPVSSSCTLDGRIASTHQVAGRIIEPGVVNVEILVAGTPDPLPTLGNGPLAVCNFGIRGDAEVGEMFPLAATNVFIGDATGGEIPSNADDGVITVTDAATPTASPTATGDGGTPTATATPDDTVEPTEMPTDGPTVEPTEEPTTEPTEMPTEEPTPSEVSFALTVNPSSQNGVQGGTAAIEVVLSSDPSGEAADSVANTLVADSGLTVAGCETAGEVAGTFEGLPGTTVSATLGDGEGSVPSGTVYTCDVAIAEDASGSLGVGCSAATANGDEITCSGATIVVEGGQEPTATPTEVPPTVAPPTFTSTPTNTPTHTPVFDSDDDGCAVGPVKQSNDPTAGLLFLLVPAALWWRRRG